MADRITQQFALNFAKIPGFKNRLYNKVLVVKKKSLKEVNNTTTAGV